MCLITTCSGKWSAPSTSNGSLRAPSQSRSPGCAAPPGLVSSPGTSRQTPSSGPGYSVACGGWQPCQSGRHGRGQQPHIRSRAAFDPTGRAEGLASPRTTPAICPSIMCYPGRNYRHACLTGQALPRPLRIPLEKVAARHSPRSMRRLDRPDRVDRLEARLGLPYLAMQAICHTIDGWIAQIARLAYRGQWDLEPAFTAYGESWDAGGQSAACGQVGGA